MGSIVAEGTRSPRLDRVWLKPRSGGDAQAVVAMVAEVLGERPRRSAHGIDVKSIDAVRLWRSPKAAAIHWEPEMLRFLENRERTAISLGEVRDQVRQIAVGGRADALRFLPSDAPLNVLDDHQVRNVAAMTLPNSPGLCVFDEQGAGKTVCMIFAYDELVRRNEIDFALLIAPKSMVGEWPKDFARFTNDMYRVRVATGGRAKKLEALRARPDVLITNFETTVAMERELEALLRSYSGRCAIVIDESFFIKSSNASRTLAVRRLREWCNRAYVLCGTPAPNSPSDIVEQFNFVDFGLTFDGVSIPADRAMALPVVQAAIQERGVYVRNLKVTVLPGLPAKTFQQVRVEMRPAQAELYRCAALSLADELRVITDEEFNRKITNYLNRRTTLLQLCSDPSAVVTQYDETPGKFAALDEILAKLIGESNEKVVLWSFYTKTIDRVFQRYARYRPVRYDGTVTKVEERQEAVQRFQQDESTKLFVGNPAAAGAGLTLHSARYAVYESMSNQAAHYLQSLDRIHRRGQRRAVEYLILTCTGTIEELEYTRLLQKEQAAQRLLGDSVAPQMMRSAMLQEILASMSALDLARK